MHIVFFSELNIVVYFIGYNMSNGQSLLGFYGSSVAGRLSAEFVAND